MFLAMFHGDQLREDADGNFLRRHGANVETNWRVHFCEQFGRHVIGHQRVVNPCHFGAAADQAEVAQFARGKHT